MNELAELLQELKELEDLNSSILDEPPVVVTPLKITLNPEVIQETKVISLPIEAVEPEQSWIWLKVSSIKEFIYQLWRITRSKIMRIEPTNR